MPEKQDAIEEEKGPGIDDYENTQLKRVIKVLDDLEKGGKRKAFPLPLSTDYSDAVFWYMMLSRLDAGRRMAQVSTNKNAD